MTDRKEDVARTGRPLQRPSRSAATIVPAMLCAALGLALLVLAVPRTIAAWFALGAAPALDKLQMDKSPYDAELVTGISALERSIFWIPSGKRLTDLGLLLAVQAERLPPDDPRREDLLKQSEQHLVNGLLANPADGFAWLRLAVVRELRGEQSQQIAVALAQSIDVAPNMRRLWLFRAALVLRHWRSFSVDDLMAMQSQLRTIWSVQSYRLPLLQLADKLGQGPILRWALSGDATAESEYDQLKELEPR